MRWLRVCARRFPETFELIESRKKGEIVRVRTTVDDAAAAARDAEALAKLVASTPVPAPLRHIEPLLAQLPVAQLHMAAEERVQLEELRQRQEEQAQQRWQQQVGAECGSGRQAAMTLADEQWQRYEEREAAHRAEWRQRYGQEPTRARVRQPRRQPAEKIVPPGDVPPKQVPAA